MTRTLSRDALEISVCVDCVMLLANGELTDPDGVDVASEHDAKIAAQWGDADITLGGFSDETEDADGWFSWSPCQGCGSQLGGSRFSAVVWGHPTDCAYCAAGEPMRHQYEPS